MILILGLDLDILCTEMKFVDQAIQKLEPEQDRQTGVCSYDLHIHIDMMTLIYE